MQVGARSDRGRRTKHRMRKVNASKQNLLGRRFGWLQVVGSLPWDGAGTRWLVRCRCGQEKAARASHIVRGLSRSCGCRRFGERGDPKRPAPRGCQWIPLTKGAHALVDARDFEMLSRHRWYLLAVGYAAQGGGKAPMVYLHRVVAGAGPRDLVDHRNGDKLDNRRANLRLVTPAQSSANTSSQRGSSSKFRGVSFDKRTGRWVAQITKGGEQHFLGRFKSEEEAARAYDAAARWLYGKMFTRPNFP